jgi:ABC-2 type transport system permease protein
MSSTSSRSRRTSRRSSWTCTGRQTLEAELYRRGLRDHQRSLAAWCVGALAYVALIAAIYPSIEGSPELDELVESYPDVLKELFGLGAGSITSGAGYLDAELFSFMLPIFVLFLAIGSGARTFAGEEDAGRLELVLSYPLKWRDAVLSKGLAVGTEVGLLCVVIGLALLMLDPIFGLDLQADRIAAAAGSLAALGLLHGWLALGVGAVTASRALAIGVPAGVAAAGYLVNGLHSVAGWLDPFRFVSSFWLVGSSPLQGGSRWSGVIVVCVAAVVLGSSALLVERRDLETP